MKDYPTKFHLSDVEMHLETAMWVLLYPGKSSICLVRYRVLKMPFKFNDFSNLFVIGTNVCVARSEVGIASQRFYFTLKSRTILTSFLDLIFTTCLQSRLAQLFVEESFLRLWLAFCGAALHFWWLKLYHFCQVHLWISSSPLLEVSLATSMRRMLCKNSKPFPSQI